MIKMAKKKRKGIVLEHLVNQEPVLEDDLHDERINIGYLALHLENEAGLGVTEEDYQLLDRILVTAKARIIVTKIMIGSSFNLNIQISIKGFL